MGGMPVHISLSRSSSHTDLFPHTDPKDFKDGYALRYAGMLGTPTVSTAPPSATTTLTATQCGAARREGEGETKLRYLVYCLILAS